MLGSDHQRSRQQEMVRLSHVGKVILFGQPAFLDPLRNLPVMSLDEKEPRPLHWCRVPPAVDFWTGMHPVRLVHSVHCPISIAHSLANPGQSDQPATRFEEPDQLSA